MEVRTTKKYSPPLLYNLWKPSHLLYHLPPPLLFLTHPTLDTHLSTRSPNHYGSVAPDIKM